MSYVRPAKKLQTGALSQAKTELTKDKNQQGKTKVGEKKTFLSITPETSINKLIVSDQFKAGRPCGAPSFHRMCSAYKRVFPRLFGVWLFGCLVFVVVDVVVVDFAAGRLLR